MTKKMNILMAAACLGLMLLPGISLAADSSAASAADQGQYSDPANPQDDQPEASGEGSDGNENAMPEDGMNDEESAPADEAPDDGDSPDGEVPAQ